MNYTKVIFNKCPLPECSREEKDAFSLYWYFPNRYSNTDIEIRGERDTFKCELWGQHYYNLERHKNKKTYAKNRIRRCNKIKEEL